MATEPIGYARLVEKHALPARPLTVSAVIDTAVKGRTSTVAAETETLRFEPKYRPEDAIAGDLQFALKYEGVNLEVLALLFAKTGKLDIEAWLAGKPESGAARPGKALPLRSGLTATRRRVPVSEGNPLVLRSGARKTQQQPRTAIRRSPA